MRVTVVGAGVSGLVTDVTLAERGATVTVLDKGPGLGPTACSWFAGGMLAPWCEAESADRAVVELGQRALSWWGEHGTDVTRAGTLVVAPPRDTADLTRFAKRTEGHAWLDEAGVAAMEPDLAGRFRSALFFAEEAHLNPRDALAALAGRLRASGGTLRYGETADLESVEGDRVVDCRGYAAASDWPGLRGVKGEMLILRTKEVSLRRPVRLLHPRLPLYVVPRADDLFMVGATQIESDDRRRVSARALIELLSAAYALHPAFAEAEVVEVGTDVRPAFADNLPALREEGRIVRFNGLYRHGFLLSPAYAARAADMVLAGAGI